MKLLKKIGILCLATMASVAVTSCGDDSDGGNGSGKASKINIDGVDFKFNHCYRAPETDGLALIFTNFDAEKITNASQAPSNAAHLGVYMHGVKWDTFSGEKVISPNEYSLEISIAKYEDSDKGAYAWEPDLKFSRKDIVPGNITLKRNGDKISLNISNFWMVQAVDGGWSNYDDFTNGVWINGSYSYDGKVVLITDFDDEEY